MEAVTFGPGNVAERHWVSARVSMAQLRQVAELLARVARHVL